MPAPSIPERELERYDVRTAHATALFWFGVIAAIASAVCWFVSVSDWDPSDGGWVQSYVWSWFLAGTAVLCWVAAILADALRRYATLLAARQHLGPEPERDQSGERDASGEGA